MKFSAEQTESATAQTIILVKLSSPAFLASVPRFTYAPPVDQPVRVAHYATSRKSYEILAAFSLLAA